MAIEFRFILENPLEIAAVEGVLNSRLAMRRVEDKERHLTYLVGGSMWCRVYPASDLSIEIMKEEYDINGVIAVLCRANIFELNDAFKTLADVSCCFLSEFKGDMVMSLNGETEMLLRKQGNILIDDRDPRWVTLCGDALASAGLCFDVGHIKRL